MQLVDFELLCVLLWQIWFHRNKALHGGRLLEVDKVISWSASFLQEVQQANAHPPRPLTATDGSVRWLPPPASSVKVNMNAAVDVSSSTVDFGMVVRNSSGLVLGSSWQLGSLPKKKGKKKVQNMNSVDIQQAQAHDQFFDDLKKII
ncbi:hypothetical protein ACOSP7_031748 [Xanthoceras sorbifolium]